MKIKKVKLGQYIFETKNLDGPTQEFLDETAPLIGYLVHSFNTLEEELNSKVCSLINDRADEPGLLVIYKMNYSAKVDLLDRYLTSMQSAAEKKIPFFDAFVIELKELGRLRNAVIHADWETSDFEGYTFTKHKVGTKGMEQEYIQFTPDSLSEITLRIQNAYLAFESFDFEREKLFS